MSAAPQEQQVAVPQQPAASSPADTTSSPWPLYDLFMDVPHPAASSSCPSPFLIGPPVVTEPALAEELGKNVPQSARFAFPEYDESAQQGVDRSATLNKYDQYAMQASSFEHFTFTLQLSSGVRLHGHVRRYLPPHLIARTRYDIGRRGQRALIILTRASGADLLYAAMLKSVEAISSQQASTPKEKLPHEQPQKWFLHELYRHHQHYAQVYASKPPEQRGKPLIATIEGLELGPSPLYKSVDTNRFILPSALLYRIALSDPVATKSSSLLPLLRCVGVAHAVRIMSALLSERRIVMVSASPTRLATCSHAALGILAQGMMHWQHLYIPVLPPHLWQYLAAPYPYLIGILAASAPRLDRTDGLGEVLVINLDSNTMETRGMPQNTIVQRLPDLFQNQEQPGAPTTASEVLAQELVELLKVEKKALYGESTLQNIGENAVKAGKIIKSGFMKLRDKGRQYLQQRAGATSPPRGQQEGEQQASDSFEEDTKSLAGDYIYTEGCHNEVGEEEARVAFTTFLLCMFGDMRWYLSTNAGGVPQLDRSRFLKQKRSTGEAEGSPMWFLLQNFCQTQMLEEFSKARIEEIRANRPVTPDAPLFLQCANYLRQHNCDFGLMNVRRVVRQIAHGNAVRLTGLWQTNARRQTMALTSNKNYEGDSAKAIAQLVEQSRESSSVLFDVMSVLWLRIRDSKGMQWKHGYLSLVIMRNLLYHGPLAAVSEATDGLEMIRSMKYYENMRASCAQQVRTMARTVYDLLIDRAKLFHVRRVCADRRRKLQSPNNAKLIRDTRLRVTLSFKSIHTALNPSAQGAVARFPSAAPSAAAMQRGSAPHVPEVEVDLFGTPSVSPPVPATTSSVSSDMLGLFDNFAVTPAVSSDELSTHSNPASSGALTPTPDPFAATPKQTAVPQAPPQAVAPPPQDISATPEHVKPDAFASPQPPNAVTHAPANDPSAVVAQPNALVQQQATGATLSPQPPNACAPIPPGGSSALVVQPSVGHPSVTQATVSPQPVPTKNAAALAAQPNSLTQQQANHVHQQASAHTTPPPTGDAHYTQSLTSGLGRQAGPGQGYQTQVLPTQSQQQPAPLPQFAQNPGASHVPQQGHAPYYAYQGGAPQQQLVPTGAYGVPPAQTLHAPIYTGAHAGGAHPTGVPQVSYAHGQHTGVIQQGQGSVQGGQPQKKNLSQFDPFA